MSLELKKLPVRQTSPALCLGREANLEITVVGLKPVFDDSGVVEHGKEYLLMNKLGMRPTVKAQV